MDLVGITTAREATARMIQTAIELSEEWTIPYFARDGYSIVGLEKKTGIYIWIVVEKNMIALLQNGRRYFFSLNMAELRIRQWKLYRRDHLAQILIKDQVYTYLDCTFGNGSDLVMASYTLGRDTRIVGIEASFPVYIVGMIGKKFYHHSVDSFITDAVRRIQIVHMDALSYLMKADDASFDVIYFDFMFDSSVGKSTNINLLRDFGAQFKMNEVLWQEANRVAARKIIMKDRPFGTWFKQHPPDELAGGKYSKVRYGIWKIKTKN